MCVWQNLKTIKFYIIKYETNFRWQAVYIPWGGTSRLTISILAVTIMTHNAVNCCAKCVVYADCHNEANYSECCADCCGAIHRNNMSLKDLNKIEMNWVMIEFPFVRISSNSMAATWISHRSDGSWIWSKIWIHQTQHWCQDCHSLHRWWPRWKIRSPSPATWLWKCQGLPGKLFGLGQTGRACWEDLKTATNRELGLVKLV